MFWVTRKIILKISPPSLIHSNLFSKVKSLSLYLVEPVKLNLHFKYPGEGASVTSIWEESILYTSECSCSGRKFNKFWSMTSDWKRKKEQRYTFNKDGKPKEKQNLDIHNNSELVSEMKSDYRWRLSIYPSVGLRHNRTGLSCSKVSVICMGLRKKWELSWTATHSLLPHSCILAWVVWAAWRSARAHPEPSHLPEGPWKVHMATCLAVRPANGCLFTS